MRLLPCFAVTIALMLPSYAWAAEVKEITGFSLPESVVTDGHYVYVSNMGEKLDPSAKDHDGFISRLSLDGTVLERHFLPKSGHLSSPKGLAVEGGRIYVTDVDQLLAYDLNSRELLFTLDFSGEGARFLNDIAVKDKHTLFVSATDLGKIYRVKIGKNPSYRALDVEVKGPNGLYSIGNALYVAGFGSNNQPNGQLGVIRFHGKKAEYQVLSELRGYLDGVAVTPAGNVWFSDWVAFEKQGVMRVYDKASKTVAILPMSEKLSGPADFLLDEKTQMLWIPEMMAGKIRLQKRPDL